MKGFLLIILLAVTHGYCTVTVDEDVPEAPLSGPEGISTLSTGLSLGGSDGRLLSSTLHAVGSSVNVVHSQEVVIRVVEYANITGISVNPTNNMGAVVTLLDGGLGHNYVKLGFTSLRAMGYGYRIVLYGSIVCDD